MAAVTGWRDLLATGDEEERARLREAHLARLREALAAGLEQADGSELLDGTQVIEEMRTLLRARTRATE